MTAHAHDTSDVYAAALHFASGGVSHFLVRKDRTELPHKEGYFYLTDIHGKKIPWDELVASESFQKLPPLKRRAVELAYEELDRQTSAHRPAQCKEPSRAQGAQTKGLP